MAKISFIKSLDSNAHNASYYENRAYASKAIEENCSMLEEDSDIKKKNKRE